MVLMLKKQQIGYMTKLEETNVEGSETAMLHLDDWEHCKDLSTDPVGRQILPGDHQKVKM